MCTCVAMGPPRSSLRATNFFKGPLMKASNSSTDSGRGSGAAFGIAAAAIGAGGRGAVGGGAVPFVCGVSIVAEAISSSREVAASSLLMRPVSSCRGIIGMILSSIVAKQGSGIMGVCSEGKDCRENSDQYTV